MEEHIRRRQLQSDIDRYFNQSMGGTAGVPMAPTRKLDGLRLHLLVQTFRRPIARRPQSRVEHFGMCGGGCHGL